jgi:hypothetical protein
MSENIVTTEAYGLSIVADPRFAVGLQRSI